MIKTAEDIKKLGTILSVWAHPDDESFTCAGIMATAIKNGQQVVCVTATKGEAGSRDPVRWPAETIGDIRAQELKAALEVLGVHEHHWLDYMDGCCEQANKEVAAKKLAKLINRYKPNTILTFGKDGMTGHSDHCCVSCWVDEAVDLAIPKPAIYHTIHTTDQYQKYLKHMDEKLNIFFNIDEPPIVPVDECEIYLQLTNQLKSIKLQALASMPSQMSSMFESFNEDFLSDALATEAFVRAPR